MDFIENLPPSGGYHHILVITIRLTRGVILEPMNELGAVPTADTFVRVLYRCHGLPSSIVSDRSSAFTAALWGRVCQLLAIERRLSSAHHPETDGGIERWNAVIEAFLRIHINYSQDDWSLLLPQCELALNCRTSTSTGMTPFFLDHGYDIKMIQLTEPSPPPQASPFVSRAKLDKGVCLRPRLREYSRIFPKVYFA